jgi:sortase A
VETGEGTYTFRVEAVRRPGSLLTVLDPGAARLTLVTSEATKGGARQAIYVDTILKDGKAQPASTGRPTSIPLAEKQMSGDRGALVSVVIWLQGLVVVLVAIVWARARWGLTPTLLVGVPVVLAAVWGVTEAMTQLLPNLF